MLEVNKVTLAGNLTSDPEPIAGDGGGAMKTEREFSPSDRYQFDRGECSLSRGFAQLDTAQDAPYFGIWANPETRQIVTYCEGDIIRVTASTDAEFLWEIEKIATYEANEFSGIDCGGDVRLKERFAALGLSHYIAGVPSLITSVSISAGNGEIVFSVRDDGTVRNHRVEIGGDLDAVDVARRLKIGLSNFCEGFAAARESTKKTGEDAKKLETDPVSQ